MLYTSYPKNMRKMANMKIDVSDESSDGNIVLK